MICSLLRLSCRKSSHVEYELELILTEVWPFELSHFGQLFCTIKIEFVQSTPPTGFSGLISNLFHMLWP